MHEYYILAEYHVIPKHIQVIHDCDCFSYAIFNLYKKYGPNIKLAMKPTKLTPSHHVALVEELSVGY